MAEPKIIFNLAQGGLGRTLPGYDHYSSFIAYQKAASLTAGYSTIGNKIYTSVADAEADGVVNTCAEATAATSAQTVTAVGSDGDTIAITWTDWDGTVITLGSYTKVSADSTVTLVKTALVNAVNALTYATGWSATSGSTGAWTLTAPKKSGVYPNTKSVTQTIVGTIAVTNGALSGGTKSPLAIWNYQIREFFRANPNGILYFAIKLDLTSQNIAAFNTQVITDIAAVQAAFSVLNIEAAGARQTTIYNPDRTFDVLTLDALKTARTNLKTIYSNSVFWLLMNTSASTLTAFANTRAQSDEGCSVVISQSSSGTGKEYYYTQNPVIGSAGLALGIESAAAVSQSIGEVQAFNVNDGIECNTVQFLDVSFTDWTTLQATGQTTIDLVNAYGYVYLKKFPNKVGTYFSEGSCAVTISSDYAMREKNRTIDKAIRNIYSQVIGLLNQKNRLNANGTLSDAARASYKTATAIALDQMERDGDISASAIVVSTTEVVATTNNIPITVSMIPSAVGRTITYTIGFTKSI